MINFVMKKQLSELCSTVFSLIKGHCSPNTSVLFTDFLVPNGNLSLLQK